MHNDSNKPPRCIYSRLAEVKDLIIRVRSKRWKGDEQQPEAERTRIIAVPVEALAVAMVAAVTADGLWISIGQMNHGWLEFIFFVEFFIFSSPTPLTHTT